MDTLWDKPGIAGRQPGMFCRPCRKLPIRRQSRPRRPHTATGLDCPADEGYPLATLHGILTFSIEE
jgi:hypothetical protein